jgi:hypothetical protein
MKKHFFLLIFCILFSFSIKAQTAFISGTPISDMGNDNSIGSANTSRNVAVDLNGNIYVVYANTNQIKISKSIDGGQSFLPSIVIADNVTAEPELSINESQIVFVAWSENNNLYLSSSTDTGKTYSIPQLIADNTQGRMHMSTYGTNVYLIDQTGANLYYNNNNGIGTFNSTSTGAFMVYADVLTDQNGVIYTPMDNPDLLLFQSTNQGITLSETTINPSSLVFFSSYALSDGPCGTFIFVGGGDFSPSDTLGYKIDVKTGNATEITLGQNLTPSEGRTLYADSKGTLIDGYRDIDGNLVINVSSNQGVTFNTPIIVAQGYSHNIARSPTTDNIIVVYQANGQIYLSVYSDVLKNIVIPAPNPPLAFCSNENFNLPFNLNGVFDTNTLLSVSLSDEFGDFSNAIEIGSITTNINGVVSCNLPSTLLPSTLYRIQIESLSNCIQSNNIPLTIGVAGISGPKEVCVDKTIQLTSSDTPNTTMPWVSSDTNIAIINDAGLVTGLTSGTIEISYNTENNCSGTYTIEVFDLPVTSQNVSLQQCDDDTDGFSNFNLSEVNSKIVTNPSSYTISYFKTEIQAENNDTKITNFIEYQNETASLDKVWARVENDNGCFRVSEVNLIVSTTQIPSTLLKPFYQCDDGTDTTDGIATFNFSSINNDIINLFPVNQQLIINYFRNEDDALSEENPITDINNYQNIGYPNQQNIYIRVDSKLDNDCLGLGAHISLNVEKVPIANSVTIAPECDNDRDGLFSFNTSTIQETLIGNQTNVSVRYFDENGIELSSPLPNPFSTASQSITARVTNLNSQDSNGQCFSETNISFVVSSVPLANTIAPQEECDDNTDGIIGFNTSTIESTVLGNQTGLVIKYFDENNIALPRPLPNPFFTTSQTIKIRLENPEYDICYDETTVNFIVREKPDFNILDQAIICMTLNPKLELFTENPIDNNYTYTWWDENNTVISNNSTAEVTKGGIYKVMATSIFGCNSDVKEITVRESSISTINSNDIEVIDDSENNSIRINTSNLGLGNYEFRLLDNTLTVIRNYQDDPYFDTLDGGVYTVEINDKDGCGAVLF